MRSKKNDDIANYRYKDDKLLAATVEKAIKSGYCLPIVPSHHTRPRVIGWKVVAKRLIVSYVDQELVGNPIGLPYDQRWKKHNHTHNLSINDWALSHEFARAFFGDHDLDYSGNDLTALMIHFKQVAVEYGDKIYAISDNGNPKLWITERLTEVGNNLPVADYDLKRIEIELKDMYKAIPVKTHKLHSIEWRGVVPAYKWHLSNMVMNLAIGDGIVEYLAKHISPEYISDIDPYQLQLVHSKNEDNTPGPSKAKKEQQANNLQPKNQP